MPDGRFTDVDWLRTEQYADDTKLRARRELHERFSTAARPFQAWLFDALPARDPLRVLEVGCGPGSLWQRNRERVPDGWSVTLTDLSAGMLEAAQRALSGEGGGATFTFRRADVTALPFEDASFDLVIANHMLYHVPDLPRAVTELRRVLALGGRLLAATNGRGHLAEIAELADAVLPAGDGRALHGGGQLSFRLDNGAAVLKAAFASCELLSYPSTLRVTEVEPLVAYIASMVTAEGGLTDEQRSALAERARSRIEAEGSFDVRCDTGAFVALVDAP